MTKQTTIVVIGSYRSEAYPDKYLSYLSKAIPTDTRNVFFFFGELKKYQ